jgi:hypothetical protein
MNITNTTNGIDPFDDPVDRLLAEIAFSLQLPPSLHQKAVDRYEAVRNHLETTSSLFKDQIEHFYPQGSMSIDATISTKGTDDEFDLDIVAQLGDKFRNMTPLEILKELEKALLGYRGLKVVRQSRCVTLYYKDNMHLDISPSIREHETPDLQGHICHAKGPLVSTEDHMVPMNAKAFGLWYRECTPLEQRVVDSFVKRWEDHDPSSIRADAEVDEVPEPTSFVVKNTATLALQLHKRFRNIQYADYDGRTPPSVLLSFFAASAAKPNTPLTEMLIRMARFIIAEIENASLYRRTLDVSNPCHDKDVFTDRWPETISQQNDYSGKLKHLVVGLENIQAGKMVPTNMMVWLREQFGDRVVTRSAYRIAELVGASVKDSTQQYAPKGRLILPTPAIIATPAATLATPVVASGRDHTFFGKKI